MAELEKVYTLITGASSGLGLAMSMECAAKGMNLILIALRESNLPFYGQQIKNKHRVDVHTFELDLTDRTCLPVIEGIKERFRINFLINNAGVGTTSNLLDVPVEVIDKILQVNVNALTILTRIVLPELLTHSKSYLLNVSSFAAFCHMAYKTVYPASKAFVSSFSMSLREEFKSRNLSVTVINPGPIATTFDSSRRIIKQGFGGRMTVLPVQEIARMAITGTLKGRKMIVPGLLNALNYWILRCLPKSLGTALASRITGREIKGRHVLLDLER